MSSLRIDQHLYGRSKDKGFSTLTFTAGINDYDLRALELYSLYKIPTSLLYDKNIRKPNKYLYYQLDNERIVLARGIDIGRDEFGRVGNFLFHNLILKIKELEELRLTPISLIRYLEENNIFQGEPFYEEQITSIDLEIADSYQKELPTPSLWKNKTDLLPLLLYACFHHRDITAPIYITGDENKIFDFLDNLFSILPKRLWTNLSFNTFWYEDYKLPGLSFYCNSIKADEIRPPNYSLKIDLKTGTYESKIDIQDRIKYEYAKFAAQKALSDKQGLSNLYLLQELAETANWIRFIELYKDSQQDIKKIIYEKNKESILTEISQGNSELFNVLKEVISEEDIIGRVFKSESFINYLKEHHDEIITKDFIEWFYGLPTIEEKKIFYPLFLSNSWLLNLLLGKIREEKIRIHKMELMQGLIENLYKKYTEEKERYNESVEEKLLTISCEIFKNDLNVDMSETLKVMKKLPPSKNPKVLLLRALIRYKLGDSSELISLIKEKEYQPLLFEVLNNGMNAIDWERHIKAFQQNEPKPSILKKLWR